MDEDTPFTCRYGDAEDAPPEPARARQIRRASLIGGAFAIAMVMAGAWLRPLGVIGILLSIAGLIAAWRMRPRAQLFAGPRYVLSGRRIAYYQTADEFWEAPDQFGLACQGRILLTIELAKFPVETSKPEKAAVKRRAKLEKAKEEVRRRALANHPGMRLRR